MEKKGVLWYNKIVKIRRLKMVVEINTESIKLGQFLKVAGIVVNGGESKILIQEGFVKVNGQVEFARGKKIFPGDVVCFEKKEYIVVKKDVD